MCQLKCSNCYLGDMLNNPKYPDVDIDRFEDTMKRLKVVVILDLLVLNQHLIKIYQNSYLLLLEKWS